MYSRSPFRLYLMLSILLLGMAGVLLQLLRVSGGDDAQAAALRQGQYHLHVPLTQGTFYDRRMRPLNQTEPCILAALAPTPDNIAAIFSKRADASDLTAEIQSGAPFVCALTETVADRDTLYVLQGTADKPGALTAQHLLGYRQDGRGAAGLSAAYSDLLTSFDTAADLTFSVDATGAVLAGEETALSCTGNPGGGLVLTLDRDIQRITETALSALKPCPGAAVVLDCRTGDILASASTPVYRPDRLADSLDDPQSPFLNRALCAYNVGSVFKLVTAAAALEHGQTAQFMHTCTGSTSVYGQVFRCHNRSGHGLLDMAGALNASCNPYFIELSTLISAPDLHHTAELLGFGEEIGLAPGIRSVSGLLPDTDALEIAAEKANLSFGQGALLATPLQVCAMTACLANRGVYTVPRLVVGATDGQHMPACTDPQQRYALHPQTAKTLCAMMQTVLTDESHANGCPANTTAGGKTSTAQTGRYADDGTERCHAWMTGFFPADSPRYAVTVFAEDGGSGNETAAPVFRRIIEEITRAERRQQVRVSAAATGFSERSGGR